jgi:hypothetical protein
VDPDAAEPEHDDVLARAHGTSRHDRSVGGSHRAGQRWQIERRNRVRNAEQSFEWDAEIFLKPAGFGEADPGVVIAAEVLISAATRSTAAACPDVMDKDTFAGSEDTVPVNLDDPTCDLVTGNVRERK